MDIIKFSTNWNNKLSNSAFTTLRIENPNKYVVGADYEIQLNGKMLGIATLKQKRTISLDQLNPFICYIDTGYSVEECKNILRKMYPTVDFDFKKLDFCLLVFKKNKDVKKEKPIKQYSWLPYKD